MYNLVTWSNWSMTLKHFEKNLRSCNLEKSIWITNYFLQIVETKNDLCIKIQLLCLTHYFLRLKGNKRKISYIVDFLAISWIILSANKWSRKYDFSMSKYNSEKNLILSWCGQLLQVFVTVVTFLLELRLWHFGSNCVTTFASNAIFNYF